MTQVIPLPKQITDEIRFILEGIKSGRLQHIQEKFHCGTAHCFAGWHVILNAQRLGLVYIPEYTVFEAIEEEVEEDPDCWDIARADWALTYEEASILFLHNATLNVQEALLEYLEKGERVYPSDVNCRYIYTSEGLKVVGNEDSDSLDSPFLQFLEKRQAKE